MNKIHIICSFSCQNLLPILPTMQLDYRHFSWHISCVMVIVVKADIFFVSFFHFYISSPAYIVFYIYNSNKIKTAHMELSVGGVGSSWHCVFLSTD